MSLKTLSLGLSRFDSANSQTLMNRSAANLTKNGAYFLDTPNGDADSTDIPNGLNNAIAVTTALIAQRPPLAIADENQTDATIADNSPGRFLMGEGVLCRVLVNSTTDITKGDWLKPVNAQSYLVKATLGTDVIYAQALETRTADTTGPISVLLYSSGRL